MEYNTKKTKRGVGASVLIACTAMAVVIGLFAGVILMNSTMQYREPKQAQATALPEETATEVPAPKDKWKAENIHWEQW